MNVAIRADREGDHARIVPTGPFDLAHATMAVRAVENAEAILVGCGSVDVDLAQLDRIDGAGAVLLSTASRSAGRGLAPRERDRRLQRRRGTLDRTLLAWALLV